MRSWHETYLLGLAWPAALVPAGNVLQRYDTGLSCSIVQDTMEFKTCVLGPAADFLPPGMSGVGTFQTWNNAKVWGANESLSMHARGWGGWACPTVRLRPSHSVLPSTQQRDPPTPPHHPQHFAPT